MNKYLILPILVFCGYFSFSQSYFTSFGGRFGTDWGLTLQQKVLKHTTVEGIFQSSLFREETMLTAVAEQHFPLITKRINFYAGAGWHQSFATNIVSDYEMPYGISLIGGAEITFARLTLAYDFKPAFNIYGGENKWYSQSGLSLRYVIVKQSTIDKMQRKNKREKRRENRKNSRQEFFNSDNRK